MYIYSYIDRKEQLALTLMIINGLVHETVKRKKLHIVLNSVKYRMYGWSICVNFGALLSTN